MHRPALSHPPGVVLTIAGHDPTSGAGITADLQTFTAHGLFGTSAVTALTVQSTLGIGASESVSPDLLRRTLDYLCADLPPAGIKIGMLGSSEIAVTIADFLAQLRATAYGATIPIVLDPVLRASSGALLLPPQALDVLATRLLPTIDWITPNWTELAALADRQIDTLDGAEAVMHLLGRRYPDVHIVATGGDQVEPTDLLRLPSGEVHRFPGEHVSTSSTHGTGCAFSSALLSRVVLGDSEIDAVAHAKSFVSAALRRAPGLGNGRGPLNLVWPLQQ